MPPAYGQDVGRLPGFANCWLSRRARQCQKRREYPEMGVTKVIFRDSRKLPYYRTNLSPPRTFPQTSAFKQESAARVCARDEKAPKNRPGPKRTKSSARKQRGRDQTNEAVAVGLVPGVCGAARPRAERERADHRQYDGAIVDQPDLPE